MYFIKLAFKNIFRNQARSLITLAAIAFGCASLIFTGGFIEDSESQLKDSYIRGYLGHIQIEKRGFSEHGIAEPFNYEIKDADKVLSAITTMEHVRLASPRIQFGGLLGSGETTLAFFAQGVDPVPDAQISNFVRIVAGKNLEAGDVYQVTVGTGLAQALNARLGDSLVLLTNTRRGSVNAMDVSIKGIFVSMSKDFDDRAIRLPIQAAKRLLRTENTQTIVVLLDNLTYVDIVAARMSDYFQRAGMDLIVRPWYRLSGADFVVKWHRLNARFFFVIKLIIIIIVLLSIFNTMNMSVLERIGEIGTMMALGSQRGQILEMFLAEGLSLGTIGSTAGLMVGYLLAVFISWTGIPMPTAPWSTLKWVARIKLTPEIMVLSFSLTLVASVLSSVYPAMKACKLDTAKALRYNV